MRVVECHRGHRTAVSEMVGTQNFVCKHPVMDAFGVVIRAQCGFSGRRLIKGRRVRMQHEARILNANKQRRLQ